MVEKTKEHKFAVKGFQYTMRQDNQNVATRELIELGKNLSWAEAKDMRKNNKNSWIIPWYPEEKKKK